MKKLFWAVVLATAACGGIDGPTEPNRKPTAVQKDELSCRSGYVIAYDEYGNPYCTPTPFGPESIPIRTRPPRRP